MHTQSALILQKLVSFDTTSYKSNLDLIDYIKVYLQSHNVARELVYDSTGKKANLYATIGPQHTSGVLLSGHTNVVPVTNQEWRSDPFALTLRDASYFGRGCADMKGFIASALVAVRHTTLHVGRITGGTEAGLFSSSLGVPAVVCGPGNIAQAHKADEFLAAQQLDLCDSLMQRLVVRCLSPL